MSDRYFQGLFSSKINLNLWLFSGTVALKLETTSVLKRTSPVICYGVHSKRLGLFSLVERENYVNFSQSKQFRYDTVVVVSVKKINVSFTSWIVVVPFMR